MLFTLQTICMQHPAFELLAFELSATLGLDLARYVVVILGFRLPPIHFKLLLQFQN